MLLTLIGTDRLAAVHPDATRSAVEGKTRRLNDYLLGRNRMWAGASHLASPVTGGGIPVWVFEQAFLQARSEGHTTEEVWVDYAQGRLDAFGKRMIHEGEELADRVKARDHLMQEARNLANKRLPILEGLGIA